MANLSQLKREKMLKFLEQLKQQHADNESIIAFNEIENELKSKKYGLVWEQHEEKVDVQMRDNVPVFTEVKEREIIGDPDSEDYNFLIEGDNLHSLYLLEKTHRGKIDVIYIDPPYNTKNKDFTYDDKCVDSNDGYKHSKWLSFMERRLTIARNLLSEKGAILISIDDNEYSQLKLLCDSIYGDINYICSFIRKTKSMTGDDGNGLNIQHEYLCVYAKNKSKLLFVGEEKTFSSYTNPDNDPNGDWCSGDPSAKSGGDTTYFPIKNPYTGQVDYPPNGRYWAFSKTTLEKYIESGRIVFKKEIKKGNRGFIFKRYKNTLTSLHEAVGTLLFTDNEYMNQTATKELNSIVNGTKFSYPKPSEFVKKLIKYLTTKNSIILDFFAGSGTTAHAVMKLNSEDNGNRKYILCTNNENQICEKVTYNRLKNLIKNDKDTGIYASNIKYYKTEFIPKKYDGYLSESLIDYIRELVQLENHCGIDNKKNIIIYTDEEADLLLKESNILDKCKHIYISSDVLLDNVHENAFKDIRISVIPAYYFEQELIEAYEL